MKRNEEAARGDDDEGEEEVDEETRAMNKKMELRARQDELAERGKRNDALRRIMMERYVKEQEDNRRRDEESKRLKFLRDKHELKLGEELFRRKNEEMLEQKRGQALRKDSIELRRLGDELRDSCAAEAARIQLCQRQADRENTRMREIEDARKVQGWYQNDEFEKQQMLKNRRNKDQYRRDVQDQLVLNHRLRQHKIGETRRERKLVEEASQVLRDENLENQRRKRETASRLHAEERAFFEAREFWKFEEQQRLLKEDDERARISVDKMNERKQNDDAKAAAAAARELVLEKMTKKMLDDESKKREREEMSYELIAAEEKAKLDNWDIDGIAKKKLTARELRNDMSRQKLANEDRKAKDDETDRAFGDYLARERDKSVVADKRKEEERRARGTEYGATLRKVIEEKRIGYAMEILESQNTLNRDRELDEARRISVEEERSRMLEEHERRSCKNF